MGDQDLDLFVKESTTFPLWEQAVSTLFWPLGLWFGTQQREHNVLVTHAEMEIFNRVHQKYQIAHIQFKPFPLTKQYEKKAQIQEVHLLPSDYFNLEEIMRQQILASLHAKKPSDGSEMSRARSKSISKPLSVTRGREIEPGFRVAPLIIERGPMRLGRNRSRRDEIFLKSASDESKRSESMTRRIRKFGEEGVPAPPLTPRPLSSEFKRSQSVARGRYGEKGVPAPPTTPRPIRIASRSKSRSRSRSKIPESPGQSKEGFFPSLFGISYWLPILAPFVERAIQTSKAKKLSRSTLSAKARDARNRFLIPGQCESWQPDPEKGSCPLQDNIRKLCLEDDDQDCFQPVSPEREEQETTFRLCEAKENKCRLNSLFSKYTPISHLIWELMQTKDEAKQKSIFEKYQKENEEWVEDTKRNDKRVNPAILSKMWQADIDRARQFNDIPIPIQRLVDQIRSFS